MLCRMWQRQDLIQGESNMTGKLDKRLYALQSSSVREIVESVNSIGIKKEDVLSVLERDDTFFLLYYK